ncbi:pilus assembly PilX N-terminal domain-containing protein [Desulfotruncus alcoholivorax]|uniref:pilus assembly PilX N-terminal domain-containing protein n=1 Tax=Desulfotruncus alcoholivorax TaxID=265477 RepID=UPI00042522D8|nr:PilX N-terminal domain-containing pilus assembly protein [Desulfotruncus alcoholivorax]
MLLRDNRGIALPLALMVLFVLSLLGVAAMQYSMAQAKSVAQDERIMQAYYLARSGADATAQFIKDNYRSNPDAVNSLINKISDRIQLGAGEFQVEVIGSLVDGVISGPVRVKSTGYVGVVQRVVNTTLSLTGDSTGDSGGGHNGDDGNNSGNVPAPAFDMAIFADQSVEMSGGAYVKGTVGTNTTQNKGVSMNGGTRIDGDLFIGPGGDVGTVFYKPSWGSYKDFVTGTIQNLDYVRKYTLPQYPSFPNLPPAENSSLELKGGSNNDLTINPNYSYTSIDIKSNRTLTINLNGGVSELRVGSLNIQQGHIKLQGSGKLIMYVDTTFDMGGGSTINNNGNPANLLMYYNGNDDLKLSGGQKFVGSIYANTADIDLSGGSVIEGNIITGGDNVKMNGGTSAHVHAIYAPYADFNLTGGAVLKGSLVVKNYDSSGGAQVIYDNSFNNFPLPLDSLGYYEGYPVDDTGSDDSSDDSGYHQIWN